MDSKLCSTCHLLKPSTAFYTNKKTGRLVAACKQCHYARCKRYAASHREHLAAKAREWLLANKDTHRAQQREYREVNADVLKAKKRAYYLANRDRLLTQNRQYKSTDAAKEKIRVWRAANTTHLKASKVSWLERHPGWSKDYEAQRYAANPEKHRERAAKWREANPQKYREQLKNWAECGRLWALKHPDQVEIVRKKAKRKQIQSLTDSYIADKLSRDSPLKPTDIPQSLIELKRAQLLIARELRKRKK